MKLLILNDVHIGVQRTGGTTSTTASELRQFILNKFRDLLDLGSDVLINGDCFDSYQIPLSDLLQAYQIATEWLMSKGRKLYLIPGNHCLSKNDANLSSFELFGRLLQAQFPDKVSYLHGGNWVDQSQGWYAISHMPNQDLLDLEISKVPDGVKYLFLHLNYDNTYAGQSDHSLNLSRDQAKALVKRGMTLILGHEHQGRTLMNDKVIIVGNQFPTSVSDCLRHGDAQADGRKYCLQIDGDDMELLPTWAPKDPVGGFHEVDWQDLASVPEGQHFIRVTGTADSSESAAVIKAISSLRQKSDAFVITNAVKVDGLQAMDAIADSIEDIKAVSVIDLLLNMLDEPQAAAVRSLLKEHGND